MVWLCQELSETSWEVQGFPEFRNHPEKAPMGKVHKSVPRGLYACVASPGLRLASSLSRTLSSFFRRSSLLAVLLPRNEGKPPDLHSLDTDPIYVLYDFEQMT